MRKFLYLVQRTMSDYNALQKGGPVRLGKRLARRPFRRAIGRGLSRHGL
jgi:hypothetical protein